MANEQLDICYIASAGAGKTTLLVDKACQLAVQKLQQHKKVAIITYTRTNQAVIEDRIKNKKLTNVPIVLGWFEFLLQYWIAPFKTCVFPQLLDVGLRLQMVEGKSGLVRKGNNFFYKHNGSGDINKFINKEALYQDKVSEFAVECAKRSQNNLLERLSDIFDSILFDEFQDFAGFDFEIIKLLITKTDIHCFLAGDPRQHTYSTHCTGKYKEYIGCPDRFLEERVNTKRYHYVDIDTTTLIQTHRCPSVICKLANSVASKYPPMRSAVDESSINSHCVFVKKSRLEKYVSIFNPCALRWNKSTKLEQTHSCVLNMGESKGSQFEHVLIYPTQKMLQWFLNQSLEMNGETSAKLYVAITRSSETVGIVVEDSFTSGILPYW